LFKISLRNSRKTVKIKTKTKISSQKQPNTTSSRQIKKTKILRQNPPLSKNLLKTRESIKTGGISMRKRKYEKPDIEEMDMKVGMLTGVMISK